MSETETKRDDEHVIGTAANSCPHKHDIEAEEKGEKMSCPFSKMMHGKNVSLVADCPAFKDKDKENCPFQGCTTVEEIKQVFAKVPVTHRPINEEMNEQQKAFVTILKDVHNIANTEKEAMGVMSTEKDAAKCPFKDTKPNENQDVMLIDGALFEKMVAFGLPLSEAETDTTNSNKDASDSATKMCSYTLDKLLKTRTQEVHNEAHKVSFARAFTLGKISREEYGKLLLRLYRIYFVLEREFDALCDSNNSTKDANLLREVWYPDVLNRTERLEQDLEFFYGPSWADIAKSLESTASDKYCARLLEVAKNDPLLLIGHAYTRYMGDLSGGQILKRVAVRSMSLPQEEGTRFYCFENIESPKIFKNMYRDNLRKIGLQLDDALCEKLAEEAVRSFRLTIDVFTELDNVTGKQMPKMKNLAPKGQCPFGFMAKNANITPVTKSLFSKSQSLMIIFIIAIAILAVYSRLT